MKIGLNRKIVVEELDVKFIFREPNPKELMSMAIETDLYARIKAIFGLLEDIEGLEDENGKIGKAEFLAKYDELPGSFVLKIGNKAALAVIGDGQDDKKKTD